MRTEENRVEESSDIPQSVRRRMPGHVPVERVRTTEIVRHPAELVTGLLGLPDMTSAVADVMDAQGIGASFGTSAFAPLATGMRMCGPAVTLRYVPLNGDPAVNRQTGRKSAIGDRDLYGLAGPGDVAVFDCSGLREWAVFGGLSAHWAAKAGLAGALVDGATRDTATVLSAGLPVWGHTRSPLAGRYRLDTIALNDAVVVNGTTVHPGDYVVADSDGVCVIPFDAFPGVVQACLEAQGTEDTLMEVIQLSDGLEDLISRTIGVRHPD